MCWFGEDGEMMLFMFSFMEEIGQVFEEGVFCLGMMVCEFFCMCGDGWMMFIFYFDSFFFKYFVFGEVVYVLQ